MGFDKRTERRIGNTEVRASRGKIVRAEPVAALYDQGRVHHIGTFPQLEDQMANFTSDIDRPRRGIRRTALMPWSGRSANCWSSRCRAKVYMSCTASRRKPPRSAASHNLLKTCPSLARWSGSRRRRTRAEPSGGIVSEPRRSPRNARNAAEIHGFSAAVPEVRIHLPPGKSLQTFGS